MDGKPWSNEGNLQAHEDGILKLPKVVHAALDKLINGSG
jgi:hypothetical protein